ncbi:aminotransferaseclass V family protein [Aphelenchoides avenae]|nr:aminotransferaseclass V family protein [Aphelenchus avenae]
MDLVSGIENVGSVVKATLNRTDSNTMGKPVIYLDNNATTPYAHEVKQAVMDALSLWGNPSSTYAAGQQSKAAIEDARAKVAAAVNVDPNDVIFTSGGSESNNWIIQSCIKNFKQKHWKGRSEPVEVVSSSIEHPSVLKLLQYLDEGKEIILRLVDILPGTGRVDLNSLKSLLSEKTAFVSVMFANNETGVIQPVKEIGEAVRSFAKEHSREADLFFHVDASQAIGKVPVDLKGFGADVVTITARKFYGPQIGAVIACGQQIDKSVFTRLPLLRGGGQEQGRRAGTENTPMILGLGAAAELVQKNTPIYVEHMRRVRDYFESKLKEAFGNEVEINFEKADRLCNTSSVCFTKLKGTSQELLQGCKTFVASTGAACHSGSAKPSSVLLACGISEHNALRSVRFSLGRYTSDYDIDTVVEELASVYAVQK